MITLNAEQKKVVTHLQGPLLIIAGAGTGKTRVIAERISYLLEDGHAKPSEILALTFTEKATAELEERVDQILPIGHESLTIKTFHAFCDQMLRDYGLDIGLSPSYKLLSGVSLWKFMQDHLFEFDLNYYRPLNNPTKFIDALTSFFGRLKEELRTPDDFRAYAEQKLSGATTDEAKMDAERLAELARVFGQYETLLRQENAMDFAGLQSMFIELLGRRPNLLRHFQNRFKYILVDEYQDTNIAQNKLVDLLAAGHKNITVVGDDDQSIYKFRGAAISNILQFRDHYPDATVVVLTENYRSNQAILDFAYTSIQKNNPDRLEVKVGVDKKLKGQRSGTSDSIHLVHAGTLREEIDYVLDVIQGADVPLSEIALLVRANAYAQPFIEALQKAGIPYTFASERGLYQKEEVMDLTAVLRVLVNPMDDISFYRILRMPVWGIAMESIALLLMEVRKTHQPLWKLLPKKHEFETVYSALKHTLEFSKNHTVGQVLYEFTQYIDLYGFYLKQGTLEAEERILHVAALFEKIRSFEAEATEKTVMDFVQYLDLSEEAGENPAVRTDLSGEGVFISSVHGSKGLEFNTVLLAGLTSDRFPARNRPESIPIPDELIGEILTEKEAHLQEERRLFYVAVTRAKEHLYLLYSDYYNPSTAKNPRKKKLSPFVEEILEAVTLTQVEKTSDAVASFLKPPLVAPAQKPLREPIRQFSYSQLSTFESCPRQYEYQYLLKIPTPPNANLSFGASMHNTLLKFYQLVRHSKQASLFEQYAPDLSLPKLMAIYEEAWIPDGYESRDHMQKRYERGQEILTAFYEQFQSNLPRIEFLEKPFKLRVGDYVLSGRIDRADRMVDGTLEIIDYKTGKTREQKEVDADLQLKIYAMAARECFGMPASLLTLYFLDEGKRVSTAPTDAVLAEAKESLLELVGRVNESDFGPTPDKYKCGYCPFNKICDAAIRS